MDFRSLGPAKHARSLFEEFKAFAFKGNVIDLAVGVIIGGAFGNLVKSLVDNIIMPMVGVILPVKRGYEGWVAHVAGKPIPYGKFLGDVANFLIVAFALYLFLVRLLGWFASLRKEEADTTPALTKDQVLLTEIRDLLDRQATSGAGGTSPP